MTGYDIDKLVRYALDDVDIPYNWDADEIIAYINNCVTIIRNEWPESKLASDGSERTVTAITSLDDAVSISDKRLQQIVNFVTAKCFETRGAGKENRARSADYMKKFYEWN